MRENRNKNVFLNVMLNYKCVITSSSLIHIIFYLLSYIFIQRSDVAKLFIYDINLCNPINCYKQFLSELRYYTFIKDDPK